MLCAYRPLPFAMRGYYNAKLVPQRRKPRFTQPVHGQLAVGVIYAVVETQPPPWIAAYFPTDTPHGTHRTDKPRPRRRVVVTGKRQQLRFVAGERSVDIAAAAHKVKSLADVSQGHQHPAVVPGVGIAVDHVVAVELLCHGVGNMSPRLHSHSVGKQSVASVSVVYAGRHVLRR